MSSSALQVAKTATYLPDLVEVQRASFKWFLEKGLITIKLRFMLINLKF